ncbi:MAG: porin family protein [Bacteroidia bacterium]|nr:porin family protein [Bacteroidia bacterium]
MVILNSKKFSQMWLLPFLAISLLKAQVKFSLGLGPQLATNVASFDGIRVSESGFGLFGGGMVTYPLTDKVVFGGEVLLSYARHTDETRTESMYFRNGRFYDEYITEKYILNTTFLKLPLTVRYSVDLQNMKLEVGAGLQPFFWLTSTSKVKETREVPELDIKETESRTENNFSGSTSKNRVGVAAVLMAGASFSKLGIYLRYDPMLTSLSQLGRYVQNTAGLMIAYHLTE